MIINHPNKNQLHQLLWKSFRGFFFSKRSFHPSHCGRLHGLRLLCRREVPASPAHWRGVFLPWGVKLDTRTNRSVSSFKCQVHYFDLKRCIGMSGMCIYLRNNSIYVYAYHIYIYTSVCLRVVLCGCPWYLNVRTSICICLLRVGVLLISVCMYVCMYA